MSELAAASAPRFHLVSGAATHVGCVRKLNEDSYLDRADLGLWAVADGMGGHDAGDHASQLTVAALGQVPAPESAPTFLSGVKSALQAANGELRPRPPPVVRRILASTIASRPAYGQHYACVWAATAGLACARNAAAGRQDHSHVQKWSTPSCCRHRRPVTIPTATS
jgi:hypothetical protein